MLGALALGTFNAGAALTGDLAPVAVEIVGSGCPSESAFRADAEARIPPRHDRSRTLRVKVGPSKDGFAGTLEVVDAKDGSTVASRTVEGLTCGDVTTAVLLLVALGTVEEVEAKPAENVHTAPAPAPLPGPDEVPVVRAVSARTQPTFHASALAAFAGGFGPLATGGGLRIGGGLERPGLFRPDVQLGLDAFFDAVIETAPGTARRSLLAGRADICPLGLGPRRLVVRLCASGALGEIRVRGDDIASPKDEGRLYAELGGLVRARFEIAGGLGAEISAGVLAPLFAHRFFFAPNVTVLSLAPAPFAEGGLSWTIP